MTEAALIAAIHTHWEDDSRWLTYAAWQDERGDRLRAEYLRLHAALRPELFREHPVTSATVARRYLNIMAGGDHGTNPPGAQTWARWCELRYRLLEPWWIIRLDRYLMPPAGLDPRGREAVRIVLGVLIRNRQLEPCWGPAFFRPEVAGPLAGGSGGLPSVLLINASGTGGVGKCFCVVGYPGVALPREMRRALRSGGFIPWTLSNEWTVLDDTWAEPSAAEGQ
jgi:uncharacterized protein (TIGR02996 family)